MGDKNVQLLGYLISAFGPVYIKLFCFEHMLQSRSIRLQYKIIAFSMIATILAVQTQILYNPLLNLMINITAFFLLTFFYKNEWFLRLFISFAFFIIGGLAEGSAWMIGRMLFSFEMNDVNNLWLFPFICALGVAIELIYVNIVFQAISFFKRHQSKMTMFIIFLIAVLILCFVYMVVTFADTAYLIPALILSTLLIAAIAGCIYLFTDQLRVQRERLQLANLEEMLQDQVKHYTALYEANRQVAVQRHDLKNILLNMRSYIQVGEYEKLDKYVAGFQEKVQPSTLIDNGMPFIDAVLSAKMAEHAKIPFENDISMLTLEKIKQPQIAFILAGALDNAIEACEKSAKPFIRVHIGQHGRMISLVVENAADQPVRTAGDRLLTTKADNKAHGYGVKSMMQMAEQLHGMLTWRQEKQVFTLSVLMQDIGA